MEEWKDIIGYEGFYQVSNNGRIKSLGRYITYSNGKICWHKERILSIKTKSNGYKFIILYKNQKDKSLHVHRLVAKHFLEHLIGKNEVNHKDGNKSNNNINNLEWCNRSGNNQHAYDNGLKLGGEKCNLSKLTEKQVKEIRHLYNDHKFKHNDISEMYKISLRNVYAIINRKTWNHI